MTGRTLHDLTPKPPDDPDKPGGKHPDFRRWVLIALTVYSLVTVVLIVWLSANGTTAPESLVLTLGTAVGGIAGLAVSKANQGK